MHVPQETGQSTLPHLHAFDKGSASVILTPSLSWKVEHCEKGTMRLWNRTIEMK